MTAREVIVVGGPTASGKSGLALDLARALSGIVINADSIQVYRDLKVLTARPGPEDEALAPHRLYGVIDGAERCSAARWRSMALAEIDRACEVGLRPVVVGGTGLYLKTLIEGLVDIPDVPPEIRAAARGLHEALGGDAFHAELARRDRRAAARLHPGDTQRLIRAFEVMAATGRSIVDWQDVPAVPPPGLVFRAVALKPPREDLYAACDARLDAMLAAGALDEVRALLRRRLDPSLPVMKAVGVPELTAFIEGALPLDEAAACARRSTRRYAKRQLTWFRHQWPGRGAVRSNLVLDRLYTGEDLPVVLAALGITMQS